MAALIPRALACLPLLLLHLASDAAAATPFPRPLPPSSTAEPPQAQLSPATPIVASEGYRVLEPKDVKFCPGAKNVPFKLDRRARQVEWISGSFAKAVRDGKLILEGRTVEVKIDATAADDGTGRSTYALPAKAGRMHALIDGKDLLQIDISSHDKVEFTIGGKPEGPLRPGTVIELTIDTTKLKKFKRYQAVVSEWDRSHWFVRSDSPITGEKGETKLRDAPKATTSYEIEVTDGNNCKAKQVVKAQVQRLVLDLDVSVQFSTYGGPDPVDESAGDADAKDPNSFSDEKLITGATFRHRYSPFLEGMGRIRLGATNVEEPKDDQATQTSAATGSTPADPDLKQVLRDARTVDFEAGIRWAFLDSYCAGPKARELDKKVRQKAVENRKKALEDKAADEGKSVSEKKLKEDSKAITEEDLRQARKELKDELKGRRYCSHLKGEQIAIDLVGRYGFSLLSDEQDSAEANGRSRGDFFDSSFYGLAVRTDNPGWNLDESFVEFGFGRSDRFLDNSKRFKINAALFIQLPNSDWDMVLAGRFDSDRGGGPDDLQLSIGFRRDLSDFVRKIYGAKKEEKSGDDS